VSNIPRGITRSDVLEALAALDAGAPHEFGASTGWDLIRDGRLYAPKAVLGLAARRVLGRPLGPYDFKGGETSQCFRVLRDLGFTIEPKPVPARPGTDWTEDEARSAVEAYFSMLAKEAKGEPYNKTSHRQELRRLLPSRSQGSIEFKFQNISAVLAELGFPYIEGYKPRGNYQGLLTELVKEHLGSAGAEIYTIETAAQEVPSAIPKVDLNACQVEAPAFEARNGEETRRPRRASRTDFAARDDRNAALGRAGEAFVVEFEKARLAAAGFSHLAVQVEHVSQTQGDGLGYDIASFDLLDQQPIFIEVKTTNCPREFPFHVSANEVAESARLGNQFRLYRVFNFKTKPQFYVLKGAITDSLNLTPRSYLARRS